MSERVHIDPGYVLEQLRRAVAASTGHADPATRDRAHHRADRWSQVLVGIATGDLSIGARAPVADVPVWATLEVVSGGFATGGLVGAGPLEPDEEALLAASPTAADGATPRARLNAWFLGDDGQAILRDALRTGAFRVRVPEEGALLVVTWLLAHGHSAAALDVLDEIRPLADRLRFYPVLTPDPRPSGAVVRLRSAREVAAAAAGVRVQRHVARMHEAFRVWNPLQDRLVALFLDTVDGDAPCLLTEPNGALARAANGQPIPGGGWPCRVFPDGWHARASALLDDVRAAGGRRPKRRAFDLLAFVPRAASLTEGERRAVRGILAAVVTRRGAPNTERHRRVRDEQARMMARPLDAHLAWLVAERLRALPPDGGLPALEPVLAPVTDDEHRRLGLPAGAPIPASLTRKVARALEAPVEELLDRGVIGSAEVLAIVLPQISANAVAVGVEDPELRRVFSAVYTAFRRRRSLLLLHLERQVRVDELPWVAAVAPFRGGVSGQAAAARATLEQAALLAFTRFPHTLLPNKLVTELAALASAAGLDLPLVEEVAADIFMGSFTLKFQRAAQRAALLLRGSLYARYYDVPVDDVLALDARGAQQWGSVVTPGFAALCERRATAPTGAGSRVAQNGAVIEQAQVLTTHNLAVLFDALALQQKLGFALPTLADRCFGFVVRQHAMKVDGWKARLQMTKNTAYAWRQMVFFLSFVDDAARDGFLARAHARLAGEGVDVQRRLGPALAGLALVAGGGAFGPDGAAPGARRFLGWSVGPHWMFAAP